ncbi:MAG TPA: hypothetical protein VK013_15725 [Myxococcaceae bacterium]|nr:hypothetical protein [Myxococcaceae bacterium]
MMELPDNATILWWLRLVLLGALVVILGDATLDKVRNWSGAVAFTREHFAQTRLRALSTPLLAILSVMMGLATLGCLAGMVQLLVGSPPVFGFHGAVLASLSFLALLFGHQIAGNLAGANAIVPLLVLSVLAVASFLG